MTLAFPDHPAFDVLRFESETPGTIAALETLASHPATAAAILRALATGKRVRAHNLITALVGAAPRWRCPAPAPAAAAAPEPHPDVTVLTPDALRRDGIGRAGIVLLTAPGHALVPGTPARLAAAFAAEPAMQALYGDAVALDRDGRALPLLRRPSTRISCGRSTRSARSWRSAVPLSPAFARGRTTCRGWRPRSASAPRRHRGRAGGASPPGHALGLAPLGRAAPGRLRRAARGAAAPRRSPVRDRSRRRARPAASPPRPGAGGQPDRADPRPGRPAAHLPRQPRRPHRLARPRDHRLRQRQPRAREPSRIFRDLERKGTARVLPCPARSTSRR